MNIADIIVFLAVFAAVAAAVLIINNNKKNGKGSCGGDCSRCSRGCGRR